MAPIASSSRPSSGERAHEVVDGLARDLAQTRPGEVQPLVADGLAKVEILEQITVVGSNRGTRSWSSRRSRRHPAESVGLAPDYVDRGLRRDQGVAGHAAPGRKVHRGAGVVCDHLEEGVGIHAVQLAAQLENELAASELSGFPAFHDHLCAIGRPTSRST